MEIYERRIGDRKHNGFLSLDLGQHKATNMAPLSLLRQLDPNTAKRLQARQSEIEKILQKRVGKPFYSDLGFVLYCGDCCELLPRLSDFISVDLTLTSPPYNIGKEYEKPLGIKDYIAWCSYWMNLIYEITKAEGSFWLNLGYFEVEAKGSCVPIPYLVWDKSPFYLLQEVVWKYGAGVSTKRRLTPRNEKWLFYVKNSTSYTFNLDAIRDPNVKYPNQKKNGKYRCNPLGKNPSDVWEFPKVTTGAQRSSKERTGHPAQFPLRVVERIVKVSSNSGEIVLDPFAGSCSAGIGAAGLGRLFIGIEVSEEYCRLAVERYEKYRKEVDITTRQRKLF